MDELFNFAWKLFVFIMLFTSWQEILKVGMAFISAIGGALTGVIDAIGRMISKLLK